jgi:hypothetical protein
MTTRRSLVAVALGLIVAGGLAWGDNPAHAVVSIAYTGTTTIPYSGTVDGRPESVYLSGYVTINMKVVRDPDFGRSPVVLLDIDLSNVSGVGRTSGAKYVTSGSQNLVRPLVSRDLVEITFPFYPSGAGGAAKARQALASFTLDYNVSTGAFVRGGASATVDVTESLVPATE